jgi:nitrous oxide reductase accessory protein NosL
MIRRLQLLGIVIALIVMVLSPAQAADRACSECGMMVKMDSPFTAKITQGDTTLYFCDIGDLFAYLKKKNLNNVRAEVKNYPTGTWVDARKANYVQGEKIFKTPMGWGIAAFKERNEASRSGTVLDFDGMAKALK